MQPLGVSGRSLKIRISPDFFGFGVSVPDFQVRFGSLEVSPHSFSQEQVASFPRRAEHFRVDVCLRKYSFSFCFSLG